MASESPGKGIAFQGALSSANQATTPLSTDQYMQQSFQIRGDGSAAIAYVVQASNVPSNTSEQGPPYRNDAVTSPDWATVQSGSVATGSPQSGMISLPSVPYRQMRLLLSSSGSPQVSVYAFGTGAPS